MNKKLLGSVALLTLAAVLILPLVVRADCGTASDSGVDALDTIIDNIGAVAEYIGVGLAAVGFVVAGVIYLTSAGSPERMGVAKKALIAAVFGSALVVLAQGSAIITDIMCSILGQ